MDSIGANIKNLREAKRLTQGELATEIGVDKNTVWRWETNSRRPGPKSLGRLAAFFDVSVGSLLIESTKKDETLLHNQSKENRSPEPHQQDDDNDVLTEDVVFRHKSSEIIFKKGTNINMISKVVEQVAKGLSMSESAAGEDSDLSLKHVIGGA